MNHAVLVCGGRHFSDSNLLQAWMACMNPQLVLEGGASGADQLAGTLAKQYNIPLQVFPAKWDEEGKAAGFNRNQRMLEYLLAIACDYDVSILAMPGGNGTADMALRGTRAGILVFGPDHGGFYDANEPYTRLTWKMLSFRSLTNFYNKKAAPIQTVLKDVVEQTQNDEMYSGRRVPSALWEEAKRMLDPQQQLQVYEEQDVPF